MMAKTMMIHRHFCHNKYNPIISFVKRIASTKKGGKLFTTFGNNTNHNYHTQHQQHDAPTPIAEQNLSHESTQQDIANSLKSSYQAQTPTVLRQPYINSDALYLWNNLKYLRAAVGEDVVCDVEIGGDNYNNADKVQITFGEYLDYIALFQERLHQHHNTNKEEEPLIYLAQNELFSSLANDFTIPSLCTDPSYNVGHGRLYHTMIWFGPMGCVSPLHYDPLDNLLIQFVGRKRILLYPPSSISSSSDQDIFSQEAYGKSDQVANWHYAGHDETQYNTSPIDVENPDYHAFPNFKNAPTPIECTLYPGDILFIPQKWWHHVKSLDTSISVNVWWR